jgi:hypothetical protein
VLELVGSASASDGSTEGHDSLPPSVRSTWAYNLNITCRSHDSRRVVNYMRYCIRSIRILTRLNISDSLSMPETSRESTFKFSSPEGWHLCRRIIAQRLPYGPHDYQLSGITAVLDGIDMLAISATGSGKSAYIYMLMHIILGIVESPELCPMAKFPKDPAILVIYPTTALEEDQVCPALYQHKNRMYLTKFN